MTQGPGRSVALAAVIAIVTSLLLPAGSPDPGGPVVAVLASSPDSATLSYTTVCNAAVDGAGRAFTAAHCVADVATPLWLHAGGTDRCSPADWQTVSVVGTAPVAGRDVTVLELDQPVAATGPHGPDAGRPVTHGFGDVLDDPADTCRVSTVTLGPDGVGCASSNQVLCLQGPGLCPGWSGAGVWAQRALVGVVSRGGCSEPTVEVAAIPGVDLTSTA